jgi:polyhydroxyalkanoate synthesis regulator phasin
MDIFDKTLKLGLDLLSVGKKRNDLLVSDLKKHYDISESQAKKLAIDLNKHAKASHKELLNLIEGNLKGVVDKKDLTEIKKLLSLDTTTKKPKTTKRK